MNTAFIFPGQGSQYVGMGKDLYEKYSEVKKIYTIANDILGFDLACVSFEGPEEHLKQTYITQPAIFVHSVSVSNLIFQKFKVKFTAGHSLGEYTALYCSGAVSFEDCLKLVKLRGELMQKAGEEQKGTMAAIIGLDQSKVEEICSIASKEGIVQVANFNSPGQIVISGLVEGVRKTMELAKLGKAKMVKELVVHGAFHSPLMEPAKEKFGAELDKINFNPPRIPVYTNVSGLPINTRSDPGEIKRSLYEQLTSSVKWQQSVVNMIRDGADEFVEAGPGKVLQGLVKRINNSVNVLGFDRADEVEAFLNK